MNKRFMFLFVLLSPLAASFCGATRYYTCSNGYYNEFCSFPDEAVLPQNFIPCLIFQVGIEPPLNFDFCFQIKSNDYYYNVFAYKNFINLALPWISNGLEIIPLERAVTSVRVNNPYGSVFSTLESSVASSASSDQSIGFSPLASSGSSGSHPISPEFHASRNYFAKRKKIESQLEAAKNNNDIEMQAKYLLDLAFLVDTENKDLNPYFLQDYLNAKSFILDQKNVRPQEVAACLYHCLISNYKLPLEHRINYRAYLFMLIDHIERFPKEISRKMLFKSYCLAKDKLDIRRKEFTEKAYSIGKTLYVSDSYELGTLRHFIVQNNLSIAL